MDVFSPKAAFLSARIGFLALASVAADAALEADGRTQQVSR
jgi:hypothetical protein